MCAKCLFYMVRSDGVEPPTYWFVVSESGIYGLLSTPMHIDVSIT